MTNEQIALTGILFIVVVVLLWIVERSNRKLADLVPLPVVQELIRSAVNTALDAAQRQVELTPTKADDELLKLIREEVTKFLGAPPAPPEPPAAG